MTDSPLRRATGKRTGAEGVFLAAGAARGTGWLSALLVLAVESVTTLVLYRRGSHA